MSTVRIVSEDHAILGNVRPAADRIRSQGDHLHAENDTSLQDQIDQLYGLVKDFSVDIPVTPVETGADGICAYA